MKQKIEWYREVLELEPGSRVFFPLAKLLAADGQTSDAVFALQQGLLRHPDHLEARLLLVELLFLQDAEPELRTELDGLAGLFASYPGFWKAWSERLSTTPALHDAALAMRFFSAALEGKKISWAAIIEQGMQAVMNEAGQPFLAVQGTQAPSGEPMPVAAVFSAPAEADGAPELHPATPVFADGALPSAGPENAGEEQEEGFSLRTRSMAEVLAEQGDISGALEIYQELMQNADEPERASLEQRAEELRQRTGAPTPAGDTPHGENVSATPGGESTRLVSLLESLAQRLEERAR